VVTPSLTVTLTISPGSFSFVPEAEAFVSFADVMSAAASTVTNWTASVSLALLLPGVGSFVPLETEAVLVWLVLVELGTVKVAVTVVVLPFAIEPSEQVKLVVLVVVSQVPCDVVTVPRVKPAGQTSERLTELAVDWPLFVTLIV
jgi:hypothetical protein